MPGALQSLFGDEETTAGRQRADEIGQTPVPIILVMHRSDRPDHGETTVVERQFLGSRHTHIGLEDPAPDHLNDRWGWDDGGHAQGPSPLGGIGDTASGAAADVEDLVTVL